MEIIRSYEGYLGYLPTLRTKHRTSTPTGKYNWTITGTDGVLTTSGLHVCLAFPILVSGNERGILTHSEPDLLDENLSEIGRIIGRPRPYSDVVALYSSRCRSDVLEKMRNGLNHLFPDSEIDEQTYDGLAEWICLDIEERKLIILKEQHQQ